MYYSTYLTVIMNDAIHLGWPTPSSMGSRSCTQLLLEYSTSATGDSTYTSIKRRSSTLHYTIPYYVILTLSLRYEKKDDREEYVDLGDDW